MGFLGSVLDLDKTLNSVLGGVGGTGGTGGTLGLLSPVTNLVNNLTGLGGVGGGTGVVSGLLDLDLLNDKGVVQLTLLGQDIIVLPKGGGIIDADLLEGTGLDGLTGGLTGLTGLTNIIELDGLLSDAGLLNLTGLLGDTGILSLDGLLGEVLKLLGVGGDPKDPLDPDGEVDPKEFDHQLIGTANKDTFTIPQASTYVDGKGNIDIANFAASSEGFAFAVGKNAVVFAKGDEMFYMRDVERVNFTEGTLILDTGAGENAGMAYRLYQAAFDRTPDGGGLEFWINYFDTNKGTLNTVSNHFIHSAEFIKTFGTEQTVSNSKFVELMYTHTLGRDYEKAGFDFWVDKLASKSMSRADVLANFSESAENIDRVGESIDNGIWIA